MEKDYRPPARSVQLEVGESKTIGSPDRGAPDEEVFRSILSQIPQNGNEPPRETVNILFVDDEPTMKHLMHRVCQQLNFEVTYAGEAEKALSLFSAGKFQIVVADIGLPGIDGLELMKKIKAQDPKVDVVIITGDFNNYTYADVVRNGASDFLAKPFDIGEFHAKIQRVIRERRLIEELERKSALLSELSITDDLTQLYNRRHFYRELERETSRAARQNTELSLLMLDLDDFKTYNDTNGHRVGDELLKAIGKFLPSMVRHNVDGVFRYGGDEFAVLLVQTTIQQAAQIAEKIRAHCLELFPLTPFSIGVAQFNKTETAIELFEDADRAMYKAKTAGGNCVHLGPHVTATSSHLESMSVQEAPDALEF